MAFKIQIGLFRVIPLTIEFDYEPHVTPERDFLGVISVTYEGQEIAEYLPQDLLEELCFGIGQKLIENPPSPEVLAENRALMGPYRENSQIWQDLKNGIRPSNGPTVHH